MRARGLRWPFVFFFLVACGALESCWGATSCESPLLAHTDTEYAREFLNIYQCITSPSIHNTAISTATISTLTAVSSATITNLTVTNLIGGPKPLNILINGGFEIWQRGTSFGAYTNPAGEGIYQSDRWKQGDLGGSGAAVWTVAQETGNIDTGVRSLKLNITSLGGGSFGWHMIQLVENYQDYFGQVVTLSVRVKTNSSGGVTCAMDDGVTETIGSSHSGGNAWETLTVTKTISASATKLKVWIGFSGNTATVSTTYLDSAMLVWGSAASSFIGSDKAIELARSQRYYEKSYDVDTVPGTITATNALYGSAVQDAANTVETSGFYYKVQKRTAPSVTLYRYNAASTTGAWNWFSTAAVNTARTTTIDQNGTQGFTVFQSVTAADAQCLGHWTADAEM